jgi:TonB-linked SusC/RagA family outer membrane protein
MNSGNNSLIEQRINYNKSIAKHSFSAMAAMTYESDQAESINAYKTSAPGNDPIFQILDAATSGSQVSGGKSKSTILSYLVRLNYAYDNRYLVTASFRTDGSSTFAEGNKWGYFPSFSLGWRLDNEDFFKKSSLSKNISSLKIRAGWGRIGNQNIDAYAPVTLIGTGPDRQWYFGNGYSQGYYPTNVGNSDIRWETSEQTNIGLDIGVLDEKLTLDVDYYIKKTDGMLLKVPIPSIAGYPNYPFSNAGSVQNKGVEATISYRNSVGKLRYSFGGNFSFYKTKVTNLGNGSIPLYGAANKTIVGGPMGRFFGYVQEGIFQNQEQVDNYVGKNHEKIQPLAQPGDFKFADLNGDGVINDQDRTFIGNPNPNLIYGFNVSAKFKSFDLSVFFQGTLGNKIYNTFKGLSTPGPQNIIADAFTKAWFKEGDDASFPRISVLNNNNNFRGSNWYVEDGSYLRLQNLQLGYSIPKNIFEKVKLFRSFRIYIGGQNLFTLTKYSGPDPNIGSISPLSLGVDPFHYPTGRTFLFGIDAQF